MRDTTKVKVHRVVLLVVDHDDIGAGEVKDVLENARYPNHCIYPQVMELATVTVDWHDGHPLNQIGKSGGEFRRLFTEGGSDA